MIGIDPVDGAGTKPHNATFTRSIDAALNSGSIVGPAVTHRSEAFWRQRRSQLGDRRDTGPGCAKHNRTAAHE
jgi:hypothetical protein